MGYTILMLKIVKTGTFDTWLSGLRDEQAAARISRRIDRLAAGNPGDVEPIGSGVSELRIDYGPGYRVYFVQRGSTVAVLLCGGDKRTQKRDIKDAISMAKSWKE
jgi:putative addiction module killer protein